MGSRGLPVIAAPFGTRRQEGATVSLEACDRKLCSRRGGSCSVGIVDNCALATAEDREHGVLGNSEDHLPTRGGCSGEAGNAARWIRVHLQPCLHTALPKRLVCHDRAARLASEAIEAQDDGVRPRRALGPLLAEGSKPRGLANAAVNLGPDRVHVELPCVRAGARIVTTAARH